MRKRLFALLSFAALILLSSCGSSNSTKEKELELKNKELELKEKEIQMKQDSIDDVKNKPAVEEKQQVPETSIEKLLGNWYMPGDENVNVKFFRDKTVVLNDYDSRGNPQTVTGTFELSGSTLTLLYDDRPKQSFRFYKGPAGRYYIESKTILFIKGENR